MTVEGINEKMAKLILEKSLNDYSLINLLLLQELLLPSLFLFC